MMQTGMIDQARPPARGLVDAAGRLVEADPRLADLNARAGGALGAALAVPQLATLARLARRLGILISRAVTVADGEDDVELWVRAEPDAGNVRLAIRGWQFRAPWSPPTTEPAVTQDFVRAEDGWPWEVDATLRLTMVAQETAIRAGADMAGLLGQPLTRLFALGEAADGGFPILAAVASQASFADQPASMRGRNEAVVLSGVPRIDAAGRFAGFVGTARTVDAAPEAPPSAESPLPPAFGSQLDKALRGPLGRIVANADSISAQADGPLRHEYADYAADISTAGRHLMGLVDDLLDLQFVEREDFTVASEHLDLADVARRAAGLLAVRADARGVRIDRPAVDETLPATGEFRRALQILVNLIANAVRYTPDGGMVWLRLEREGAIAAVIVADQGKGIAPEDQARIFEKFERVDPGEPGGSGLGLYIARRLARAMGGDIVVDSAPGQGARFVFTLPAR